MHTHPNARLTPLGRERLVRRHIDERRPLAELAFQAGISLRTAYKWLARFRSGGPAALVDRRSVRRNQRRTLDPQQQQQATALRHERCTMRRIAKALAAPLSTTGRWLKSMGLGRLKNLQPKEPVRRYQWAQPGDMIHVDTKQLARFERVGHRITGDRRLGCSPFQHSAPVPTSGLRSSVPFPPQRSGLKPAGQGKPTPMRLTRNHSSGWREER